MYQHICKNCGKAYKNYKQTSSFCSLICRNIAYQSELLQKRFGKLVVIDTRIMNRHSECLCLCDCGNKVWIKSNSLKRKLATSCGCKHRKIARITSKKHFEKQLKQNCIENTNLSNLTCRDYKNNTSGVKGVSWNSQHKKWVATLRFQKVTYSKQFVDKQDAINYRKELEKKVL